ncbi:MAG: septum formation initiator family protein [Patescibacteria group bacterium]
MKEFQEKRKFKKIIYSTSFQVVFGILVLFLIFSTIKAYKKSERSADKTKETRKEILVLEKRNAELLADVASLESDSGKESEIRKRFDVAKPGEKILIIVDKNSDNVKINNADIKAGFFFRAWQWFKRLF